MIHPAVLFLTSPPALGAAPAAPEPGGSSLWWEEYDQAEAQVATTLRTWDVQSRAAAGAVGTGGPSHEQLQALRARRGALATERELLMEARRQTRDRDQDRAHLRETCTFSVGQMDLQVQEVADETTALYAEVVDSVGSGAAGRALQRWWEDFRATDWSQAWAQESGMDRLVADRRSLEAAAADLAGEPRASLTRLLSQADDEERQRLSRWRASQDCLASQEAPTESMNLGELEARLSEIDRVLGGLDREIASLEGQLVGDDHDTSGGIRAQLAQLDRSYARLASGFDSLDTPVSQDAWCAVLIHGALVRLAVHGEDAQDLLQTAAVARENVCHSYAAEWLSVPLFQSAWSLALFNATYDARATVRVYLDSGDWSIDGLPVAGLNVATVSLRPGLHRVEHRSPAGRFQYQVLPVGPGDRLTLAAQSDLSGPQGILIDTFEEQLSGNLSPGPVVLRALPPSTTPTVVADEPPRRLSVFVSPIWIRLFEEGHTGGTVQVGWRVARAPWIDLELGVAHDQAMGAGAYLYTDEGAPSRFLFRERLTATARGGASWPLRPTLELSVGAIPLNAALLSTQVGLELPINHRLYLAGFGSLGLAFWQGASTPLEPAAALGVGTRL